MKNGPKHFSSLKEREREKVSYRFPRLIVHILSVLMCSNHYITRASSQSGIGAIYDLSAFNITGPEVTASNPALKKN